MSILQPLPNSKLFRNGLACETTLQYYGCLGSDSVSDIDENDPFKIRAIP
jgi:hypothetical protein